MDQVTTIGVNCGGAAVDGLLADQPYVPGSWGYDKGLPWDVRDAWIARVRDPVENDYGYPDAFKTFRFHAGAPLHYKFDLPNGFYEVKLYFCEQWRQNPGERVFAVRINGEMVLPNLDIVKEVGSSGRGLERVFSGVAVPNGQLDLEFSTVEHDPVISIIVVRREGTLVPPAPMPPPRYQA